MICGRPFTLQYAREQVAPEFWGSLAFVRTIYVISALWALAFLVMVIAELALLYIPGLPKSAGMIAIVLALIGAMKFTGWYPEHVKRLQNSPPSASDDTVSIRPSARSGTRCHCYGGCPSEAWERGCGCEA
jgi:hypothetical protein